MKYNFSDCADCKCATLNYLASAIEKTKIEITRHRINLILYGTFDKLRKTLFLRFFALTLTKI